MMRQMQKMKHLLRRNNRGNRSQDGQHEEEHAPSAQPRAKCHGAAALQPAQVDLTAAIDAGGGCGELPIGANERISGNEFPRAGQIGELELVASQRVTQVAHVQEAALDDAVKQFLDELDLTQTLGKI